MDDKKKILKKSDIFYHIVKSWRIILLFMIAGLAIGITVIGFGYVRGEMAKEYRITASVVVTSTNSSGRYSLNAKEPNKGDVDFERYLSETATYIIKSYKNMQAVVDELKLQGASAGDISRNLGISRYNETEILELTLLWRTEREGRDIMEQIIKTTGKTMQQTMKIGGLNVINEPRSSPIVGGNIGLSTWIYAALVGLVIGVLFSILKFIISTTVINEIDLDEVFGLDSLGAVPLDVKYAKARPLTNGEAAVEDDIKSVAHLLINRLELAKVNKLYITSTEHKEGKTRLIVDIAMQFSKLGKRTLLVDCNFKNPMLGNLLTSGLTYEQSLNALYRGDSDKIDAIVHINGCLDLLPAVLEEVPESFNDAMLVELSRAMEGYDYVMIDAAPVGDDAEVLRLNEITDTAVFVIRCDFTKVDDIKKAIFRLSKSGIPIAGGIFNCVVNWKQTVMNTPRHLRSALRREAKKRRKELQKAREEKKAKEIKEAKKAIEEQKSEKENKSKKEAKAEKQKKLTDNEE